MLRRRLGVLIVLALASSGCSASLSQRPVKTDAELGRVIVYRSGVAYFERHARVVNGKLVMNVPAERVDDFLKSLRITDIKTGKSLPLSFPTLVRHGDMVELGIELPKEASREIAITYVTESPAWKPSYRVELGKEGKAKLEAWAVVATTCRARTGTASRSGSAAPLRCRSSTTCTACGSWSARR
jgi:hypothetical protein